jgi:hypothetical protein
MMRALPALSIPTGPDELSAEWLSAALASGGALDGARVTGFRVEIIGLGEGFLGTIARLHLEFDPPGAGPASLIGKFPIALAQNKGLGEMAGAYEREIRFYRELAHRIPIPIPRCYYTDMDRNPGAEFVAGREDRLVGFLDRWPYWLIRMLMPVLQWAATLSRRRYVLLLEDLAPAPVGDQVAGCAPDVALAAVRGLAELHAAFWGRVDTPDLTWLPRLDWIKRWFHVLYQRNAAEIAERLAPRLPELPALAAWLSEHGVRLQEQLARHPRTLIHGDYRLDNMCLGRDAAGEWEITTFDWQSPIRGAGVYDLAYFLPGNLEPEAGARAERDLVRAYHAELCARGVRDYPLEVCERGYRLGKLAIWYRLLMGLDLIDFSSERGTALIENWLARQAALLPERYPTLLDPELLELPVGAREQQQPQRRDQKRHG